VNESAVLPDASFTASTGVLTGEAPFVLDLQNTSVNANTYSWYFGDGGANSSMVDPSVTYSNAGVYQIELIASNNGRCADTARVTVVVEDPFSIPDGYSPNGDGVNDLFVIDGIDKYPENSFVVFNRWGNMVYEAKPYNNEWDGTSSKGLRVGGDKLPVGTYFYILDLGDGSKVIKGNVYLKK
jgi:gliding motility-associated-like protein